MLDGALDALVRFSWDVLFERPPFFSFVPAVSAELCSCPQRWDEGFEGTALHCFDIAVACGAWRAHRHPFSFGI
jgi:hypothetical protein